MVSPDSNRVSRAPFYSGYPSGSDNFEYGTFTLFGKPSQTFLLSSSLLLQVLQPRCARTMVWALLRSLAATGRISIDFFSCRYLDVSVPYVRSSLTTLLINVSYSFHCKGLPHSEISGSKVDYHLTEAYRRLTTSFIASYCQGIHRMPLIALS